MHGAHRVAVLLHHSADAVRRMLHEGQHASHLCHHPTCVNHEHIVVESKEDNEARKSCRGKVIVKFVLWGKTFFARPSTPCPHNPPCILPVEEREVEEVEE